MTIQVLNSKDSDQLEVVRDYDHGDPAYYQVMNRPLRDLAERTSDINTLCLPARFLRVRSTGTPSASVEVEIGYKLVEDPLLLTKHTLPETQSATQTLVVAGAALNKRRIDIIYYDMDADTAVRVAGTEVADTTTWPDVFTTYKAKVPSVNTGTNIPLAYLYVDNVPTPFDHAIAINNAGHIRPCQIGPGMNRRQVADSAGVFASDGVVVGVAGVSNKAARIDHQHPLNVDDAGVVPDDQYISSAVVGTEYRYVRADHEHYLYTETDGSQVKKDSGTGVAGTRDRWVGQNHQHAANIDGGSNPAAVTSYLAGTSGSSDYYVRPNHRHATDGVDTRVGYKTIPLTGWRPNGVDANLTTTSNLQGRPFVIWWFGHFHITATNYSFSTAHGILSQGITNIAFGSVAYSSCWAQSGTNRSGSHEDNSMYHASWPGAQKECLAIPHQNGNNGAFGWHNYPDVFCSFQLTNVPTTSTKPIITGTTGPGNGAGGYAVPAANPTITGKIVMMYMYQRTD
jgi:hypothetical protein